MVYCICGRLVNINVGSFGAKDIHDVFGTNWAGVGCVGELVGDDGELFVEIIKELYCLVKRRCPQQTGDKRRKMGEGVRKSSIWRKPKLWIGGGAQIVMVCFPPFRMVLQR